MLILTSNGRRSQRAFLPNVFAGSDVTISQTSCWMHSTISNTLNISSSTWLSPSSSKKVSSFDFSRISKLNFILVETHYFHHCANYVVNLIPSLQSCHAFRGNIQALKVRLLHSHFHRVIAVALQSQQPVFCPINFVVVFEHNLQNFFFCLLIGFYTRFKIKLVLLWFNQTDSKVQILNFKQTSFVCFWKGLHSTMTYIRLLS